MGEEMGPHLQQILRSLCLNTEWKYAVFWKLKHRARMVLTLEDAYYDNHEIHERKRSSKTLVNLCDGQYLHDPLGLAVAKMSYHVYSLGEGIVGQVAITGKHQWIFADKPVTKSCSSFEYCDGWQTQFSAGIRTIVVVAVVPHGVVQLGSLHKVVEDIKLVNRIREVFFALQNSLVGYIDSPIQCNLKSNLKPPDISARSSCSEVVQDYLHHLDETVNRGSSDACSPVFPCLDKYSNGTYAIPLPGIHQKELVEVVNKDERGVESSMPRSKLLEPNSEIFNFEYQKEKQRKLFDERKCEEESSFWRDVGMVSDHNVTLHAEHNLVFPYLPPDLIQSWDGVKFDHQQDSSLHIEPPSDMQLEKDSDMKLDFQFSAGCELHEALGPAFLKQSHINYEEKTEVGTSIELPEGMTCSQLTTDSVSENLLEAVVAKVCHSSSDTKSEKSMCKSLLITENLPEPSSHTKDTICSASGQPSLIDENSPEISPGGISSTCLSTYSEQLERSGKGNKKRARPGENTRPRPRDRQLIQDRIKELRELIPSGSKCSIDSLLERTIKHMLFLQSTTKHADKLKKCAESKAKEKGYDQGSSWAVEVGSHLKVCTIIVENLNMNGQMLVEMLCEECSHFLEIAEAIRSLGLMILKGVTEARGDKTWICFVVEGQNNRSMHRMDILWSLVQILQPKAA